MFIQGAGTAERTYDAIVVGSGISGGWAAKELTEKGLRTLVLERGRDVKHPDYPTAMMESWQFAGRNRLSAADLAKQEKQNRTGYTTHPASAHWFVNDVENPYSEVQRFDWMRGYHVGGRSLLWGRQSYRWSDLDFEANARDGLGVDWPIRYADIAPWYDYVERFAGISGSREGLPQLPDGQFLPPMAMNCLERQVKERIAKAFGGRAMIIGRVANLTQPHNGRGSCQYRNRCIRGCPYGAYFSSNASTLPAALRHRQAHAAPVLDRHRADLRRRKPRGPPACASSMRETNQTSEYFARVIFLCASAIASTFILLNSKSDRFPNGLGNDSGELGHNLMDHHFSVGASGLSDDFGDRFYKGQRPNGIYIPRFRNLDAKSTQKDYVRGFGYQGSASRENWARGIKELSALRRRPQGRSDRAGTVAVRHRFVGRVPAVPREPDVPERHAARQVGPADGHLRLRLEDERAQHAQGHDELGRRDARGRRPQERHAVRRWRARRACAFTRWARRAWAAIRRRRC